MRRIITNVGIAVFGMLIGLFTACDDEGKRPEFPFSSDIFHSVAGKQVAFTALTHGAVSWEWDFGDGNNSNEQNPVHVYEEGGYYVASLTAKDASGEVITKEIKLAVELTPYALLTGDHTVEGYNGKTWKLSSAHSTSGDYLADADVAITPVKGVPVPLPTGIFDLEFGMGDIYKDEYTFHNNGSYRIDVKEDGGVLGGLVFQFALDGGAGIINANGAAYGLCIATYTPEENATFTYVEEEDLVVPSVYGAGGAVTFQEVSTLDFSGDSFIGFRDFQRKIILNWITDTKMQLTMFMAASPDHAPMNTHALVLSFDAVR
ncbi:MAG: PKD domain-containing protein [Bacteroidales bacterium]|nr:PKD domain-containing protein [Bacteroidales bacterium]